MQIRIIFSTYQLKENMSATTLIDAIKFHLALKTDKQLCERLPYDRPSVSKMRHDKLPVGDTFILRAHKATNIPVRKLEELASLNEATE